jgi:hypothetical protein
MSVFENALAAMHGGICPCRRRKRRLKPFAARRPYSSRSCSCRTASAAGYEAT